MFIKIKFHCSKIFKKLLKNADKIPKIFQIINKCYIKQISHYSIKFCKNEDVKYKIQNSKIITNIFLKKRSINLKQEYNEIHE